MGLLRKLVQQKVLKVVLFFIYFVVSFILISILYNKAMVEVSDIYNTIFSNWSIFLVMFLFTFLAFIFKVFRWMLVIDLMFVPNRNFFLLLNLSSISLLLNQLGLSIFIADGIKSGVLTLKNTQIKNKILVFFSSYIDRVVGIVVAIILSLLFLLKSSWGILFFFILLIFLLLIFWNNTYYRFVVLVFLLSFLSQVFDCFSLYIFIDMVLGYRIDFGKWFLAFIIGSFSSLLSVFGGLGGRALGMNLILGDQNFKIPFMIDVIYYLLQLFCAIFGGITSIIVKYISK